jgi:hypothetical protein
MLLPFVFSSGKHIFYFVHDNEALEVPSDDHKPAIE